MKYTVALLSLLFSAQLFAETLVIAHRGASGYLPEHSLVAKTLAYAQGADYIEQDVVLSKDGIPVILHDILLDDVTDVAKVYSGRQRKDGHFYAADFTLAELKQLQLFERFNPKTGKRVYPNRFPKTALGLSIVTLAEEISLIQGLNKVFNKDTGIYVEIKAPAWHRAQGLDISKAVLNTLADFGYQTKADKAYVQCFDFAETQRLRHELGSQLKLVQLIGENSWKESATDYDHLKSTQGVAQLKSVVDGVGPYIPQLLNGGQPSQFYLDLKAANLPIHAYTLRKDQLPENTTFDEVVRLLTEKLKLEGIFTDFPDMLKRLIQK